MSIYSHNPLERSGEEIDRASTGEDTLRLIAQLTAPEGLEKRLHGVLRNVPRQGRVLAWRLTWRADAAWVRATAAAAIVMVVAGGGWSVYSHIQPWQPAGLPAVPAHVGTLNGFSSAGAVRTPQTLQPPVLRAPANSAVPHPLQKKTRKKSAAADEQTRSTVPASF